jgi:hypothetical protein
MMEAMRPAMRVELVVGLVMCSLRLQWRAHGRRMIASEVSRCRLLHQLFCVVACGVLNVFLSGQCR